MPYYRFSINQGEADDEIINAPNLRTAWKQLPDRFDDDALTEMEVQYENEVAMPDGFEEEDDSTRGGTEEGSQT